MIHIFVMAQAKVPDLVSQIEMIKAFASEYMRSSEDGCEISKAYQMLLSGAQYLLDLGEGEDGKHNALLGGLAPGSKGSTGAGPNKPAIVLDSTQIMPATGAGSQNQGDARGAQSQSQ